MLLFLRQQSYHDCWMFNEIAARSPVRGGREFLPRRPIRRAWRDIHAGTVHVSPTWGAVSRMYAVRAGA